MHTKQPSSHTGLLEKVTQQENLLQQVLNPKHQQHKDKTESVSIACFLGFFFGITFPNRPLLNGLDLPQAEEREHRTTQLWVMLKLSAFNYTLPLGRRWNGWRQWVELGTLNLWVGCQYMMASPLLCILCVFPQTKCLYLLWCFASPWELLKLKLFETGTHDTLLFMLFLWNTCKHITSSNIPADMLHHECILSYTRICSKLPINFSMLHRVFFE